MAYYQVVKNINTDNNWIKLKGALRYYIEIQFSGYANNSPYDILKLEYSTDKGSTYNVLESHTLTAPSGIIKTILNKVPKTITNLRLKGYDSDGSTAIGDTSATELYKVNISGVKGDTTTTRVDILKESKKIAKDMVDSNVVNISTERANDKEITARGMLSAISSIETNDNTDIIENTITDAMTTYGLSLYPAWLRSQITENKNWCINGSDMETPHWILDGKIYTFKETGSDNGQAIAKKCEEVLSAAMSREIIKKEKEQYSAGQGGYLELSLRETDLTSILNEKVALI